MKTIFLQGIVGLLLLMFAGWSLWMLAKALFGMVEDYYDRREFAELQLEMQRRRAQRQQENQVRLDNGCQHVFSHGLATFPPGVCLHCGLAREKPPGDCDHVWREAPDPLDGSLCTQCGREYHGL